MNLVKIRIIKPHHLFVLLCVAHPGWVQAEIYKKIDKDGRVTYSNSPMKGSIKLGLEPPNKSLSPSSHVHAYNNASPSNFPRVDNETQKIRDGTRRKILEDELAAEEKLLTESRRNLKDREKNPEITPKKIKDLQEQVSLHEKNMAALRSELAYLK